MKSFNLEQNHWIKQNPFIHTASAAYAVLREFLAATRRDRPGADAGGILKRRRARRPDHRHRQPAPVPLRTDRVVIA